MKRILFFGPLPPAYTGQSIAFSAVVDHLKNEKSKVIDISGKDTVLSGIGLCFRIIYTLTFYRFDLIYFTCSRSFFGSIRDVVLLFCARTRNISVVNHLHGGDFKNFYDGLPPWYRSIVRWCYHGVGESIVLTEGMKENFEDFPKMKLTVVSNSYSSDLDTCPVEKRWKPSQPIRLLYLSNIMKMKGILHLLDVIEVIFSKYENIHLSIAGTPIGDIYCSEEEIADLFYESYGELKSKYPDKIDYLGVVTGEAKKQLLWNSDVFVLPTFYPTEAFPISILEALRTGNFILTTDHRFIPAIVSNNNGVLIEPDSTIALFEALDEIAEHPERLQMIQNMNIWHALEHYQEEKYLKALDSIFRKELI